MRYKRFEICHCFHWHPFWQRLVLPAYVDRAKKEDVPGRITLEAGAFQTVVLKDRSHVDRAVALVHDNVPQDLLLGISGAALFEIGLEAEGLQRLREMVSIDPCWENVRGLTYYVARCEDSENGPELLELNDRLFEIDPTDVSMLEVRGFLFAKYKQFAEAEKCFLQVVKTYPRNRAARYVLGLCLAERDKFAAAIKEYKRVLWHRYPAFWRRDPERHEVWGEIAYCYFRLEQFAKARRAAVRALKIKPGHEFAKMILDEVEGRIQVGVDLFERSCETEAYPYLKIEASKEIPPGNATLCLSMLDTDHAKNPTFVNNAVEKIGQNLPRDFLLACSGAVKFDIGRTEEGLGEMRKAVDLNPSVDNICALASRLATLSEGREQAKQLLDEAMSLDPKACKVLLGLAELTNDREEALTLYRELSSAYPEDPFFRYELGRTLAELGRFQEALVEFEEACHLLDDGQAEVSTGMARCFVEMGNSKRALACAKRAVLEDPSNEEAKELLASLSQK